MNGQAQSECIERVLRHGDLWEWQRELLRIIAGRQGRAAAIGIREILRLLCGTALRPGYDTELVINERAVKDAVKQLIERFDIRIGGAREKPCGYFLIVTPEDQQDAVRPLRNEIKSLARRIRKLSDPRFLAQLFRQLEMELDKETQNSERRTQEEDAA